MPYEYTRETKVADGTCFLLTPINEMDEDGIQRTVGYNKTEVFCTISSIYWQEYLKAYEVKLKPKWKLVIFAEDYGGQMLVEFKGRVYNVYRSFYLNDNVEIYLREDEGRLQSERVLNE